MEFYFLVFYVKGIDPIGSNNEDKWNQHTGIMIKDSHCYVIGLSPLALLACPLLTLEASLFQVHVFNIL